MRLGPSRRLGIFGTDREGKLRPQAAELCADCRLSCVLHPGSSGSLGSAPHHASLCVQLEKGSPALGAVVTAAEQTPDTVTEKPPENQPAVDLWHKGRSWAFKPGLNFHDQRNFSVWVTGDAWTVLCLNHCPTLSPRPAAPYTALQDPLTLLHCVHPSRVLSSQLTSVP